MGSTYMRHRWWRREKLRMIPKKGHNRVASSRSCAQSTATSHRMNQAEANVRTWVADLRGGFDAGSGGKFDGRLDALGSQWHKQDDREHEDCQSNLNQRIVDVKRAVSYAEDAVRQAEGNQRLALRNYESARERLSGELPTRTYRPTVETETDTLSSSSRQQHLPIPLGPSPGSTRLRALNQEEGDGTRTLTIGGPNYREPHLLPGRSSIDMLMWFFVLLAVAGDITVFYTVLARLLRADPVAIIAGAVGFTAAAIGICHLIGIGLQRRRSGDRRRSDGLLWASIAAWLALGCLAFFARLYFGVQTSDALATTGSANFGGGTPVTSMDRNLLAALFFSGLYLVSGLLAMTASFYTFNPHAQAYRHATRKLKKAARNVSNAKAYYVEQLERQKVIDAEQARAPERRKKIYRCTEMEINYLKIHARQLMAADLQDPRALDLLMRDAPIIKNYPELDFVS
jgi:hypothetical protein